MRRGEDEDDRRRVPLRDTDRMGAAMILALKIIGLVGMWGGMGTWSLATAEFRGHRKGQQVGLLILAVGVVVWLSASLTEIALIGGGN
jgi:hypothetical protein